MNTTNQIIAPESVYRTEKGTAVTDSMKVAHAFGRLHKNVLKSIRSYCAKNLAQSQKHFKETTYTDARGRHLPLFIMTQEGFSQIVLRFNSTKANDTKDRFVELFAKMTAHLTSSQQTQQTPAIPKTYSEALFLAAQLQQEKEQNASMLSYAQSIVASKSTISVGELAKILCQNGINIGEIRLFEILRNNGFLGKIGDERNIPTQRMLQQGIMEIKYTPFVKANGVHDVHRQPRITTKGQVYFINRFKYEQQNRSEA